MTTAGQNAQSGSDKPPVSPAPPVKSPWGRRIIILVVLAAAVAVYMYQLKGPSKLAWPADLNEALVTAKAQQRPLAVFFRPARYSDGDDTDQTIRKALGHPTGRQALERGNYLYVQVPVAKLTDALPAKYHIERLPTLLVLSPAGQEVDRHVGFIGESDCQRFLSESAGKAKAAASAPR